MTTEIIIVNWNNRRETLDCLAAVESQLPSVPGASITVVDNGSTDGSAEAITARHPAAKLFALPDNRGFTGGLAAALSGSTADEVIFLNNDAIPEPGWLSALVDALRNAPDDVVSVGGRITDADGKNIDFIGGVLTFDGHALQNGFHFPVGAVAEPDAGAEILFACGGNMISRRKKLTELGGFDDEYFAYLEDVDFGWRTWISGSRVLFEPRASVRHAGSTTSNRLGDFERGVLFERNALQTAIKNHENLTETGAAIFYAYLRRLHHYATTRNLEARELRRPFGTKGSASRTRSRRMELIRRFTRRPFLVAIDDPLTAMQFRAFEWFVENEVSLAKKRESVQKRRTRSDAEIFERFPLHFIPTYPGDEALLSSPIFRILRPALPSVEKTLDEIMRR
jgi:GT2 family glycosyltransferase